MNKYNQIITACFLLLFVQIILFVLVLSETNVISKTPVSSPLITEIKRKPIRGFKITAYCPCKICNGKWAGLTALGKPIKYYTNMKVNICAVDPKVIPLGSVILYNAIPFLAIDVGGKVKGKHIDILLPTHKETIIFGVKYKQTIYRLQ